MAPAASSRVEKKRVKPLGMLDSKHTRQTVNDSTHNTGESHTLWSYIFNALSPSLAYYTFIALLLALFQKTRELQLDTH